jgi:hypothetical protein
MHSPLAAQTGVGLLHVSASQAQLPFAWQAWPSAPQASPTWSGSGTHVPGVVGPPAWQVKHSPQVDVQAHEPQSTASLQRFLTRPHLPPQVFAFDSGWHLRFLAFPARLPVCLRWWCGFLRRLRRPLAAASSPRSAGSPPRRGSALRRPSTSRREPRSESERTNPSKCLASMRPPLSGPRQSRHQGAPAPVAIVPVKQPDRQPNGGGVCLSPAKITGFARHAADSADRGVRAVRAWSRLVAGEGLDQPLANRQFRRLPS